MPGGKASWPVTGIRQDAYANAHRIPVEEWKPENERGFYLHPELFGQPETKSVEWARNPEMMKHLIEMRKQEEGREAERVCGVPGVISRQWTQGKKLRAAN